MKKVLKQSIMILLAGILVLSMVGCNKTAVDSSDSSETTKKSTEKKNDSTATEAPAKEVDPNINLTGYPIVKEPITLTMTGKQGATKDWQNTIQLEQFKEQFGIEFKAKPYSNDSWQTQFTLMLSTNEMTDVVVNTATSMAEINKYGGQGYFLPLNEYLEYMPNLQARFEMFPEWKAALTAPDGNIYGIAKLATDPIARIPRLYLNKVWLDNVGMEEPTNLDEVYEVLKAFQEQDANGNGDPNDEIPMAYNTNFYWYSDIPFLAAFGLNGFTPHYLLVEDGDTVSAGNTTENYKNYLKYMKKLYSEGLIDQEAFTQTRQEVEAKANEELVGLVGCPSAPFAFAKKTQNYDRNWTAIGGFSEKAGGQGVIPLKNRVAGNATMVVSADTEHPIEIARLIDFLVTDEGILCGTHGFEGHSYKFVDMEGVPVNDLLVPEEGYESDGEFRQQRAVIQSAFSLLQGVKGYETAAVLNMTDERLEEVKANTEKKSGYWRLLIEGVRRKEGVEHKAIVPSLVYTEVEGTRVATLKTDIITYIETAKAQFITGEVDIDDGWGNYVKTLEQMGLKELIEIERTAYERMFSD